MIITFAELTDNMPEPILIIWNIRALYYVFKETT